MTLDGITMEYIYQRPFLRKKYEERYAMGCTKEYAMGYAVGYAIGWSLGRAEVAGEGKEEQAIIASLLMYQKGIKLDQIAEEVQYDTDTVARWISDFSIGRDNDESHWDEDEIIVAVLQRRMQSGRIPDRL